MGGAITRDASVADQVFYHAILEHGFVSSMLGYLVSTVSLTYKSQRWGMIYARCDSSLDDHPDAPSPVPGRIRNSDAALPSELLQADRYTSSRSDFPRRCEHPVAQARNVRGEIQPDEDPSESDISYLSGNVSEINTKKGTFAQTYAQNLMKYLLS